METKQHLETIDYARKAVDVASDKQATDILLLDISKVSTFTDFFVIMTAESRRQMDALSEDMEGELKRSGASLHHREGSTESGWLLLDFGDLIVHLFAPEEREFYQLEELWAKGQQVVRVQ
ncbi:MAG: ribosome silencing factor [Dehalococcoidia bacterium]|nr:ribosome silencing factor [Dehalococcoidia bacterium]